MTKTSSKKLSTAYIAFGSNIEDRKLYIEKALDAIKEFGSIVKVSDIIETEPEGCTSQGKFLNGVLEFKTLLSPQELLKVLKQIEQFTGRRETFKNGPREIDLDIIFYEDKIIKSEKLALPHPRAHLRSFVLRPLLQIAPNFIHPEIKKSIKNLCDEALKKN
ncbi:MAG TPA: 2-amino-4-hydroxy-6-hydroxymethyldihydropteridine diphosphokinase [Elusimicrobiales bacterium]|nr:2-amino-4-hydroxy-6-hydroxymethyldihydropteridine diphosphokinase [Elusimicrobiales bacterium]